MYKVYKGHYDPYNKIKRNFIRIANQSEEVLDEYIGCYTLNTVKIHLFAQDNLRKDSTVVYLPELIINIEAMKYQEVFDLLNHIISSRDFLKRNRGKCVNSKNQIRFMGGVDNCRDVFISYLYKCLLFFDEYD